MKLHMHAESVFFLSGLNLNWRMVCLLWRTDGHANIGPKADSVDYGLIFNEVTVRPSTVTKAHTSYSLKACMRL